jgi:hypothetical protein
MLSTISTPVAVHAVGLPAQWAIAQRFSAVAHHVTCRDAAILPELDDKRTLRGLS